jgi:hypothetical protein
LKPQTDKSRTLKKVVAGETIRLEAIHRMTIISLQYTISEYTKIEHKLH